MEKFEANHVDQVPRPPAPPPGEIPPLPPADIPVPDPAPPPIENPGDAPLPPITDPDVIEPGDPDPAQPVRVRGAKRSPGDVERASIGIRTPAENPPQPEASSSKNSIAIFSRI